jgi:hypothetical protein
VKSCRSPTEAGAAAELQKSGAGWEPIGARIPVALDVMEAFYTRAEKKLPPIAFDP